MARKKEKKELLIYGKKVSTNIYSLDLSNMNIRNIKDITNLNQLKKLRKLNLSHNQITEIDGLEKLTTLKDLDLSNNNIDEIKNLNTLSKLKDLNLASNKIIKIKGLGNLRKLSVLNLSNNKIEEIIGLRNLRKLSVLNLSNNKIEEIIGLRNLRKLSVLNLSNNKIEEIASLENQRELLVLNLSNNRIEEIKGLGNQDELKELFLSNNKIHKIDFSNFPDIWRISLESNPINIKKFFSEKLTVPEVFYFPMTNNSLFFDSFKGMDIRENEETARNYNLFKMLDKRTYFIAERVILSQIILLLLTGLLSYTFVINRIYPIVVGFLIFLIPIGLLLLGIFLNRFKEILYYKYHWSVIFIFFLLIWLIITTPIGIYFEILYGPWVVFLISLLTASIIFIGYIIAKCLRILRYRITHSTLAKIVITSCLIFMFFFCIPGVIYLNIGLNEVNELVSRSEFKSDELFLYLLTYPSVKIGAIILLTGFAIPISIGLNYLMLHSLYDPKGLDILDSPPNELYFQVMIFSLIFTFILWLFFMITFPIGGGGGGSKGSRDGGRSLSDYKSSSHNNLSSLARRGHIQVKYLNYQNYGTKKKKEKTIENIIESEWEEYN